MDQIIKIKDLEYKLLKKGVELEKLKVKAAKQNGHWRCNSYGMVNEATNHGMT